jgi:polyvinyl alcohol dehydrogenase (cytochrome)
MASAPCWRAKMAAAAATCLISLTLAQGGVASPAATPPAPVQTNAPVPENKRGAEIFNTVCAACHANPTSRAPSPVMLSLMSPNGIVRTLKVGVMRAQGEALSDSDKTDVAEYLTKRKLADGSDHLAPPVCKGRAAQFAFDRPPPFPGWGLTLTNTRDIPAATAGINRENLGKLHLKWAVGFSGAIRIRSEPMVAGGAVYVGSQDGVLYALDLETGCARWQFQAPSEIRTPIIVSSWAAGDRSARPYVYFGDEGDIYAVDAVSGVEVWHRHPDDHPKALLSGAPVLYKDKLYVPVSSVEEMGSSLKYECCTFRGVVIAYSAREGKELWRSFTVDPPKLQGLNAAGTKMFAPAGAAVWNAPAIDEKRSQLYIGTGDNYARPTSGTSDSIIAMDLNNGAIKWVYQATAGDAWNTGCLWGHPELCPKPAGPDYDFGAAPILATARDGRDMVVAAQKSGFAYGIDPDTGKLVWKSKVGRGGTTGGIEFGLAVRGESVFVGVNDFEDALKHPDPPRPGLYALDLLTGKNLWQAPDSGETCRGRPLCTPGIFAAITATPDLVFAGDTDGWLRAYDADNGRVLWHYDMTQSVTTVGGGQASGGSMGGPTAPIAVGGKLIVPSGFGMVQYTPGNVLFVFDTK